jgi:hypothetical protein
MAQELVDNVRDPPTHRISLFWHVNYGLRTQMFEKIVSSISYDSQTLRQLRRKIGGWVIQHMS